MKKPPHEFTIADVLGADNTATHFEEMAKQNKGVFDAHINAGFEHEDAIAIVLHMVGTLIQTRMMIESHEEDEDGTD